MPKVKVFLEKGESDLDADIALYKALSAQMTGDIHATESFDDPAMVSASERFEQIHENTYKTMIEEIVEELEKEYQDGDF